MKFLENLKMLKILHTLGVQKFKNVNRYSLIVFNAFYKGHNFFPWCLTSWEKYFRFWSKNCNYNEQFVNSFGTPRFKFFPSNFSVRFLMAIFFPFFSPDFLCDYWSNESIDCCHHLTNRNTSTSIRVEHLESSAKFSFHEARFLQLWLQSGEERRKICLYVGNCEGQILER